MKKTFSITQSLTEAFALIKSRFLFFVLLPFIPVVAGMLVSFISTFISSLLAIVINGDALSNVSAVVTFIVSIASWILTTLLTIGVNKVYLASVYKEEIGLRDLLKYSYAFIPLIIANFIIGGVSIVAFLLFILPGILWYLATMYVQFEVLTNGTGPIQAIKNSLAITNGAKMRLFLFEIVLVLINFAGALLFIVGLLITVPLTSLARVFVYKKLKEQTGISNNSEISA